MATSMFDSVTYGALWRSAALSEIFDEVPRTRAWLEILAVLAEVEAEYGLIPADAAQGVAKACRGMEVDGPLLLELASGREATGHSTAGLIRAVARRCPPLAGEWVHYGATVQDLTDTWLMSALKKSRQYLLEHLEGIHLTLSKLARTHRDTVMPGRTHGQKGLPITFGFKVAGWVAELGRHRRRFSEAAERLVPGPSTSTFRSASRSSRTVICDPMRRWTASRRAHSPTCSPGRGRWERPISRNSRGAWPLLASGLIVAGPRPIRPCPRRSPA